MEEDSVHMNKLITVRELNTAITSWMSHRHDVNIEFDGKIALQHLELLGLLKSQKLGKINFFFIIYLS